MEKLTYVKASGKAKMADVSKMIAIERVVSAIATVLLKMKGGRSGGY